VTDTYDDDPDPRRAAVAPGAGGPSGPSRGDQRPDGRDPGTGAAEAAEPDDALASHVRAGLRWNLLSNIAGRLVTPLVGVVLARLLSPDEYGVFAVGLVALNALVSMNDLGMTLAVVRWPGDPVRAAPTAATLAVGSSVLLCGASVLAAPAFARLLGSPEATGVLRLMSLGVIVDGLAAVPIAGLTRDFVHRRRVLSDWVGFVASTGGTLALAVGGAGAWSLAGGRIAGSVATAATAFAVSPLRARPGWDPEIARPLMRFGLPLAGSSLLVFAMLNVDYAVVGHELGSVELGLYLLAFNLSSWPVNTLSNTIRRVSIAGFGRIAQRGEDVPATFLRGLELLALVAVPACVALATLSRPLVDLVYGDRWRPAAAALEMLAVLGAVRVVLDLCYDLLAAVGRARALLVLQAVWLAGLVPALVIGARAGGIRGVGAAHAVVAAGLVAPCYIAALRRAGVRPADVVRRLARPFAGGVVAAAAVVAARGAVTPELGQIAVGSLVLVAAYGAVVVPGSEIPAVVRRRRRGREPEPGVAAPVAASAISPDG
jgi:PST family polysaccharide transporter